MTKIIDSEIMQAFAHYHHDRLRDACLIFFYNDYYFLKITFFNREGEKIRTQKLRIMFPKRGGGGHIHFLIEWFEEANCFTTDIERIQIQGFTVDWGLFGSNEWDSYIDNILNSVEDDDIELAPKAEELNFKEMLKAMIK